MPAPHYDIPSHYSSQSDHLQAKCCFPLPLPTSCPCYLWLFTVACFHSSCLLLFSSLSFLGQATRNSASRYPPSLLSTRPGSLRLWHFKAHLKSQCSEPCYTICFFQSDLARQSQCVTATRIQEILGPAVCISVFAFV